MQPTSNTPFRPACAFLFICFVVAGCGQAPQEQAEATGQSPDPPRVVATVAPQATVSRDSSPAIAEEVAAWDAARQEDSLRSYVALLDRYPEGPTARRACARLLEVLVRDPIEVAEVSELAPRLEKAQATLVGVMREALVGHSAEHRVRAMQVLDCVAPLWWVDELHDDARNWLANQREAGLNSKNPRVRQAAITIAARQEDSNATDLLAAAVDDGDPGVARAVVRALGKSGDERAVGVLLQKLEDEDPLMRRAAVWALGNLGDPRAVAPLIACLDDPQREVSQAAIGALGGISDARAVAPLVALLASDDPVIAAGGRRSLERLGTVAVDGLVAALVSETAQVRARAATALGSIGAEGAVDGLARALEDPDPKVARAAAVALGFLGDPRALEPITRLLQQTAEPTDYEFARLQREAVRALGRLAGAQAVETLAPLLDGRPDLRVEVREVLREAGALAVEPLLSAAASEDAEVRRAAISILGGIRDPEAADSLAAVLDHDDPEVRVAAATALAHLGDARAAEPLVALLGSDNLQWTIQARWALCELGPPAVEPLAGALQDRRLSVRWAAARTLARLREPRAVPTLIGVLTHDDIDVRWAAAQSLALLGDRRALEPLVRALEDPVLDVRAAAAWALGDLGDQRAVEPLRRTLEDKEPDVRVAAAWALARLGEREHVGRLAALLTRWDDGPQNLVAPISADWRPQTMADVIHVLVCQRDADYLRALWPATRQVLLADASSDDLARVHYAADALIWLGMEDTIPTLLDILQTRGSEPLAETYARCGRWELRRAAADWAAERNYQFRDDRRHPVRWGGPPGSPATERTAEGPRTPAS